MTEISEFMAGRYTSRKDFISAIAFNSNLLLATLADAATQSYSSTKFADMGLNTSQQPVLERYMVHNKDRQVFHTATLHPGFVLREVEDRVTKLAPSMRIATAQLEIKIANMTPNQFIYSADLIGHGLTEKCFALPAIMMLTSELEGISAGNMRNLKGSLSLGFQYLIAQTASGDKLQFRPLHTLTLDPESAQAVANATSKHGNRPASLSQEIFHTSGNTWASGQMPGADGFYRD